MRALGQKLVKCCTLTHTLTHTHTHAAKLVVEIACTHSSQLLQRFSQHVTQLRSLEIVTPRRVAYSTLLVRNPCVHGLN